MKNEEQIQEVVEEELPIVEPAQEEREVPPNAEVRKLVNKTSRYKTEGLGSKDSSAFWLVVVCLAGFVIATCIGACILPNERTALITGLIDTLKYVITASLGYLFATTTQSKD